MTAGYTKFLSHAEAFFRLSVRKQQQNTTEDFQKFSHSKRLIFSFLTAITSMYYFYIISVSETYIFSFPLQTVKIRVLKSLRYMK